MALASCLSAKQRRSKMKKTNNILFFIGVIVFSFNGEAIDNPLLVKKITVEKKILFARSEIRKVISYGKIVAAGEDLGSSKSWSTACNIELKKESNELRYIEQGTIYDGSEIYVYKDRLYISSGDDKDHYQLVLLFPESSEIRYISCLKARDLIVFEDGMMTKDQFYAPSIDETKATLKGIIDLELAPPRKIKF